MALQFVDLKNLDYLAALKKQQDLVQEIKNKTKNNHILFVTHPSVVTLGRSSQASDLKGWAGEVHEVSRGGRATYHGPGQLVIYPIIDLNQNYKKFKSKDVMAYLKILEQLLMETFLEFDIQFELKETVSFDDVGKKLLNRGLWFEGAKVVSIGIAIKHWITYHGAAINLFNDPEAFTGISPCGYKTQDMKSLESLGHFLDREELIHTLEAKAQCLFEVQ